MNVCFIEDWGYFNCLRLATRVGREPVEGYGGAMTYTLRLLKMPERAIREEETYDDLVAALEADNYSMVAGGEYVAEITDDDTGDVVHTRAIPSHVINWA